ncbi:unnamed protein product [Pieris macdunnoughi]|uniref:Uncharacterized protein n=1 Tax=Pieris macdunnoughi TaxID=345717 RepID=A0A821SY23_9NEOP|nr:unnamed protein product [Pieris macdunnoughi]
MANNVSNDRTREGGCDTEYYARCASAPRPEKRIRTFVTLREPREEDGGCSGRPVRHRGTRPPFRVRADGGSSSIAGRERKGRSDAERGSPRPRGAFGRRVALVQYLQQSIIALFIFIFEENILFNRLGAQYFFSFFHYNRDRGDLSRSPTSRTVFVSIRRDDRERRLRRPRPRSARPRTAPP